MHSPRTVGLAWATAGAIAFSGKAIVAKLMYRHGVDAFTVVGLRMALSLPWFLLMIWWAGRPRAGVAPAALSRRDAWRLLALGFLGYYLASTLDFLGLHFISAGLERAILYLNPTLVLLLGVVFMRQRPSLAQWGAMLLAYFGLVLVWAHDWQMVGTASQAAALAGWRNGQAVAMGAALVFASALAYAIYLIGSGSLVGRLGSLRLVGWSSSTACVFGLLQWAVVAALGDSAVAWLPVVPSEMAVAPTAVSPGPWGLPWAVWGLSLVNALVCTVVPVWMVMRGVQLLGAGMASQVGMLGPLSTIWLAAWFLDEAVTGRLLGGTGLILLGVVWLARAGRSPVNPVRPARPTRRSVP